MTPEEFVKCCHKEKTAMLSRYFNTPATTAVGIAIGELNLSPSDLARLKSILDDVLTDTFMALLYAIDGCASLGGKQRTYRLLDEDGTELTGELQGLASEHFDPR
jgi:hypothetical protein